MRPPDPVGFASNYCMRKIVITHEDKTFAFESLTEQDVMYRNFDKLGQFYELPLLEELQQRKIDGHYLDLGANIGNHSVFFASFCPAVCVHAVEPVKPVFKILKKNLAYNVPDGNYKLYRVAVASKKGKLGHSKIDPENVGATYMTKGNKVQCDTIDSLFRNTPVSLIKMDIEGGEIEAIKGAMVTLKEHRPLLVVEIVGIEAQEAFEQVVGPLGYRRGRRFCSTPTFLYEV